MSDHPQIPAETPPVLSRKRERRKDARPGEIIEAALQVFIEKGFGPAKMEDIAKRAGVAKGTVFIYFPTKEDLFRAVAETMLEANLSNLQSLAGPADIPLSILVPGLLAHAANVADTRMPAILRLLIGEARSFPDLAQIWHDQVVSKILSLLTAAIERAQARGEVKPGDSRLYAFSIIGPMVAGLLFRDILGAATADVPDLRKLAEQHARTVLNGLSVQ